MEVVLPFRVKNEQQFFECAFKLGFDEMVAHKFLYIFHQSDLDVFPKIGNERLGVLIYSWELCEQYKIKLTDDEWELPEELELILKLLVPWSLDMWFSQEWEGCKLTLKHGLVYCLNRARCLLMRLPDMMQINWDFLLLYNQTPWQVPYLKALAEVGHMNLRTGSRTIETEELPASDKDVIYTKVEQLPLIVLRLVKLFDQKSVEVVKALCMRVLAAWNKMYHNELQVGGKRLPYVPPEDRRCLLLICHIYLIAAYESDDVKGYVIDNLVHNIRFYYQGLQESNASYAMDNADYTPARFIALTCIHLRVQKRELFEFYIWGSFVTANVNLFGVVSQAYKSYLLGNLLMELNNMNEEDFAANAALYKRLMNAYINEREKSEIFLLNEMKKLEAQKYAHNIRGGHAFTDFKSKICKGNRMSNIGHYENTDDVAANKRVTSDACIEGTDQKHNDDECEVGDDKQMQSELSVDPIFQNIPNNEEILYFVYDALSKKSYRGWQFAKIVLLFKIISHELNILETWRYHPGLTIQFMLNLEMKLSQHYTDLAKIFQDYPFMEQEFWLTAFYLNPTPQGYEAIKRLGIRNNRKRHEEAAKLGQGSTELIDTKYGLLSSTIDVKEIVVLSNTDDPNADYVPLNQALHSMHLPDSVLKDILTVVFLPRNKGFSWAVEWNELRRRCKVLLTNSSEKAHFVELTMAEANDRLKFLNIDYNKYKNRPQLDYGSIERGYENLVNSGELEPNSDESEEEDDFEDDEDAYESKKRAPRRGAKQEETIEDDSQDDDPYLAGKRRTRARTAAALASLLSSTELVTRGKRRKLEEEAAKEVEEQEFAEHERKTKTDESAPLTPSGTDETTSDTSYIQKRNIKDCFKERPVIVNATEGFQPLVDMWNIEKSDLLSIDENCISLLESKSILNRFAKLKEINKQINPLNAKDCEVIDVDEMLIKRKDLDTKPDQKSAPNFAEDGHRPTDIATAANTSNTKKAKRHQSTDKTRTDKSKTRKTSESEDLIERQVSASIDLVMHIKNDRTGDDALNSSQSSSHGGAKRTDPTLPVDYNYSASSEGNVAVSSGNNDKSQLSNEPSNSRVGDAIDETRNTNLETVLEVLPILNTADTALADNDANAPEIDDDFEYDISLLDDIENAMSVRYGGETGVPEAAENASKTQTFACTESTKIRTISDKIQDIKEPLPAEICHQTQVTSAESRPSSQRQDSYTESALKNLCLTKPVKVLLRKLRPRDLKNLRQPKVRVKRLKNAVIKKFTTKQKRPRKNVYIEDAESSDSAAMSDSSSSYEMYRPSHAVSQTVKRGRRRSPRTSESEGNSLNSYRNSRKRYDSSSRSDGSRKSSSQPSTSGHLVVTPRSASGLKLRISHADQRSRPKSVVLVDEIIQVSSSTSYDSNSQDSVVLLPECEYESDPLFEEPIIELEKPR